MPVFYDDFVFKFKRILMFNSNIKSHLIKRVGYNMDIMRQSACMIVNPINVYSFMISSLIA